jgi:hypothetical protein
MDRTSRTQLARNGWTSAILDTATIYAFGDEEVGTVSRLHGSEVVIDVGGFLGIGARPVPASPDQLKLMREEDGDVVGIILPRARL